VLAQFHHKGIVQVHATFEENNTAYMVMEFVKGTTLLNLVEERGPLPEKEVVNYITQAADALGEVHEAKVLHRDIKPENLMVTPEGRVVLVDFGTAREFASGKTKRMTAMLTPGYAPLEQYGQQARFGIFTDLYALGATSYHLLTGQLPVQATDRAAGVELKSPNRLNPEVSQSASDAVMWAMEVRADRRPRSAREFIKALSGQGNQPTNSDGAKKDGPAGDGARENPYCSRIMQLADELRQAPAAAPPSRYDARIADINQQLARCAAFKAQPITASSPSDPNCQCPCCTNSSLKEAIGRFTGICPVCRSGRLLKRKLDHDKCPICRAGPLGKAKRERPLIFCPSCRMKPLRKESRKRLGILTEESWVCDYCKAELELGLFKGSAKLVRYELDPFGMAAKYVGLTLDLKDWIRDAPRCSVTRRCAACTASFYEFEDESMMLARCATDPHGIGAQTHGKCLPRMTWLKLAHNLSSNVGNAFCDQCRAEFEFSARQATLNLLSCHTTRFPWAQKMSGQALPTSAWYLLAEGKNSSRPGWLCKQCSTEFDSEDTGLRLVHTTGPALSPSIGTVLSLADWQRVGAGVPTTDQEHALHEELAHLETLKGHEDLAFHEKEQQRRAQMELELAELVKKSALGGFIPIATGTERLPLDKNETICWNSPAGRLKQRSMQGQSYWDVDGEGTLFVTTLRVVFATPDAKRWQRPRSKLHTARVEHCRGVPLLVMGFDGLQKPVAFYVGEITASVAVGSYQCSVKLAGTDLANMLLSQFSAT
jgi:hypothetical protein